MGHSDASACWDRPLGNLRHLSPLHLRNSGAEREECCITRFAKRWLPLKPRCPHYTCVRSIHLQASYTPRSEESAAANLAQLAVLATADIDKTAMKITLVKHDYR